MLGRPMLVPAKSVVSLGSAIFAFLSAGTFKSVEEAQDRTCPPFKIFEPDSRAPQVYDELYPLYRDLNFALGEPRKNTLARVLPTWIRVAEGARQSQMVMT